MRIRFVSLIMIIAAFISLPVLVNAQGGDPGGGGLGDPDVAVPFDGGLTLVIAAGAGYAIKKARDNRKKKALENKMEK